MTAKVANIVSVQKRYEVYCEVCGVVGETGTKAEADKVARLHREEHKPRSGTAR